jgi:hypothetical protein
MATDTDGEGVTQNFVIDVRDINERPAGDVRLRR